VTSGVVSRPPGLYARIPGDRPDEANDTLEYKADFRECERSRRQLWAGKIDTSVQRRSLGPLSQLPGSLLQGWRRVSRLR
jgi:hypothetical protein